MDIIHVIAGGIEKIIAISWWLFLPLIAFFIFWNLRLIYIRTRHIESIDWLMLEVKIPKNILKTPKAMEQIFSEMIATYSFGFSNPDIYVKGKVEPWISFEMVGYASGVHFYIFTPSRYRNLIESAIYAQYSEAEIVEAEDYTELFGSYLPNKIYDVWGTDFILAKDTYYPIRTYPYFEESQEEKRLDPVAAIAEVMSNLKEDEMLWLQVLISPTGAHTGNEWQMRGQEMIEEMAGRKNAKRTKRGFGATLFDWARNIFWSPIELPVWPGEGEKKETLTVVKFLHPAEQEVVKAVSNKISKFGFETIVRFVYIDKRDSFSPANVSAVFGTFQQFHVPNLNFFKPDKRTITLKTGWLVTFFPKYKELVEFYRKRRIFDNYCRRRFGRYNKSRSEKFPILNTEELATIYHFPTMMVGAPRLKRLETKKGSPPAELPIE